MTRALDIYSRSELLRGADLKPDEVLALLEGRLVDVYDIFEAVVATLAGGSDRLCEKTPGHLWWWEQIAAARPLTRFAMIVRDPRAVVASLVETRFGNQSLAGYVEWWRYDQNLVKLARRQLGHRCLVLRYEDVVADEHHARRALQQLCARPELDLSPSAEPTSVDGDRPLALPWETWKAGYDGPVTSSHVESWRHRLTTDEANFIARATIPEMRAWGYAPDASGNPRTAPGLSASKQGARALKRIRIDAYRRRQRHLMGQTVDLG